MKLKSQFLRINYQSMSICQFLWLTDNHSNDETTTVDLICFESLEEIEKILHYYFVVTAQVAPASTTLPIDVPRL